VGSTALAVWDITANQGLSIAPWDAKFFLRSANQWNYDQTRAATGLGFVLGGSIGVGLGMAMLNPLGAAIGAGTNFVGGLISGHRSVDELTIDALIGGAFGGLFGAVVPGPMGIFSTRNITSSVSSVVLPTLQNNLWLKAITGGTLNLLQGATSRLVRNRLFEANEDITPGNLLLDFTLGVTVTGATFSRAYARTLARFKSAQTLQYLPYSLVAPVLNDGIQTALNRAAMVAVTSTIANTNLLGGVIGRLPPSTWDSALHSLHQRLDLNKSLLR